MLVNPQALPLSSDGNLPGGSGIPDAPVAPGLVTASRPVFADLPKHDPGLTRVSEPLIQPVWSSNCAFPVDCPIRNPTKFQPAFANEQKLTPL
jgi:hypothetical protein